MYINYKLYLCSEIVTTMANAHLIISNSTELLRIAVCQIMCIKADGNYCDIYQVGKIKKTVTLQLGQIQEKLIEQLPEYKNDFARVGKSLIVNINYVYNINLTSQSLVLIDDKSNRYEDSASKEALKGLKERIEKKELKYCL